MIAISYRREDSLPIAGRLYDRLHAKFGKGNVFMDFDSIPPGVDFREHIQQTIERSNLVIAVIGPHWLGEQTDGSRRIDDPTDFVRLEIEYALKRGIPVIPLLVNNMTMPPADKLPNEIERLAFRNALSLDAGIDFHHHTDRLIAGIDRALRISGMAAAPDKDRASNIVQPTREELPEKTPSDLSSHSLLKTKKGMRLAVAGVALLVAAGVFYFCLVRLTDKTNRSARTSAIQSAEAPPSVAAETSAVPKESPGVQVAALYTGTIHVQNDPDSPTRGIVIALNSDRRSGKMTQTSKHGDFVVKFTGVWDGNELHAVTSDVVSQPPGVQWTPESFTLRFTDDGKTGSYECIADENTYLADLSVAPQEATPAERTQR